MKSVSTNKAPSAKGLLSQAVVSNGLVFVAGQIHAKPDNTLVGETPEQMLDQIAKNVSAILEAAGTELNKAVKVTIYVLGDRESNPDFQDQNLASYR